MAGTPIIEQVQVFGARCSGTNWVDALVGKNFLGVELLKSDANGGSNNFGSKHGGLGVEQHHYVDEDAIVHDGQGHLVWADKDVVVAEDDERYVGVDDDGDLFLKNCILPIDWEKSSSALLIVVNRQPISWLRSRHRTPHHALRLYNLPFDEFIRQPWLGYETPPLSTLNSRDEKELWIKKGVIMESAASVFAHRRENLAGFQALTKLVQNVVFVQHEAVREDPEGVIREIAGTYNIPTRPEFVPVTSYKGRGGGEYRGRAYEKLSPEAIAYVLAHIHWGTEHTVGYLLENNVSEPYTAAQIADPSILVRADHRIRYQVNGAELSSMTGSS